MSGGAFAYPKGPAVAEEAPGQLYELRITATGEVRDADGNLIEQRPVEATAVVTAEQAAALIEGQGQQ